jgi:phage pi2 protein 07
VLDHLIPSSAIQVSIDEKFIRQLVEENVRLALEESDIGCWWDLKRLEAETCRKRDWLIENILLNPKFKNEMSIISNKREGGRWMFKAVEMRSFLDQHFHFLNSQRRAQKTTA